MRGIYYASLGVVVFAFALIVQEVVVPKSPPAVWDWLFLRGAILCFLYLFWRLVRALERRP